MMDLVGWLDGKFYPGCSRSWDDEIFREKVLSQVESHHSILDYGAGRGNVILMNFMEDAAFVSGVDIDKAVLVNPHLHRARVIGKDGIIPYADSEFDMVFSDNVMEHIEYPEKVFAEIYRVLKPGGIFMAKTPNRRHYMPLVATATPKEFHVFYNRLRGRSESDTFPTRYRCNSRSRVRRLADEIGFLEQSIDLIENRPEYLRLTVISYAFGLLYERIVNKFEILSGFRCVLIFTLRKPCDACGSGNDRS